jgi:hypothetical protein
MKKKMRNLLASLNLLEITNPDVASPIFAESGAPISGSSAAFRPPPPAPGSPQGIGITIRLVAWPARGR